MKNKILGLTGLVLLCGMQNNGVAAPMIQKKNAGSTPKATVEERSFEPSFNEKKFYLFGGLDLGFDSYSQSTFPNDASKSGLNAGVRGLGAVYLKKWVFDGGLSFLFINSSGTASNGEKQKVNTRTVYADLSPRYRLNQNWQVGPEFQYWFGSDNGLNTYYGSALENHAFMGGLQLIYEWQNEREETKYRWGARWNTDFNITARNLNVFQVFFQIGFSPFGGETEKPRYVEEMKASDLEKVPVEPIPPPAPEPEVSIPEPEPEVMSTPAPAEEEAPLPIGPQEKMVMTLDVNALPFESDSARLPKYNRDRVKEIGRFLGEQKDSWERLIVSGHTDEQGKKEYNMKLSQARADTVRQLLGEGGAPTNKIKSVGLGPTRPIDKRHDKKAWAKNRRVELEFIGVKDGLIIQKAFRR